MEHVFAENLRKPCLEGKIAIDQLKAIPPINYALNGPYQRFILAVLHHYIMRLCPESNAYNGLLRNTRFRMQVFKAAALEKFLAPIYDLEISPVA